VGPCCLNALKAHGLLRSADRDATSRGTTVPFSVAISSLRIKWNPYNTCERSMRTIAIGRKNWLFTGIPSGGKTTAAMFSLISSAKRHHVEPLAYLTNLITRLPATPISQLTQFLPGQFGIFVGGNLRNRCRQIVIVGTGPAWMKVPHTTQNATI